MILALPEDKILFLNLDFSKLKASVKDTMSGLGQIYINHKFKMPITDFIMGGTIFYKKGFNLSVIDNELNKIRHSKLINDIIENEYDIVFLRTSLPTLNRDLIFINELKELSDKVKICIFAPFLSRVKEKINKSKIDYFISGEAEFAFLDIINQLQLSEIKGLGFRKEKDLFYNGERGYNNDLNLLPSLKWDLVDYKKYSFVTCLTSKGCPYNCGYCPYPVYQGSNWRAKNVDLVIKELKDDYFNYGIDYLRFRDPEFSINRERTIELCQKMIENKIKIKWHAETRLDLLDRELLEIMKRAGCEEISFAIETINDKTCRVIRRKKIENKKIEEILNVCQEIDIKTFVFFIIGLPEETKKTTLDLINFSLKINSYLNEFTLATPYPGTQLRKWAEERNLLVNKDFDFYTSREVVMKNGLMSVRQLKNLCKFANLIHQRKLNKRQKNVNLKRWIYYRLRDIEYYYLKTKIKFL